MDETGRPATIIGGVAVIAHGFARFTADIDVAVVATPSELPALLAAAKRTGFRTRINDAERFAQENLVLLLQHARSKVPVDVSLALQEFEHAAAERALLRPIGAVTVRVPPLEAVLIYKMVAGRPKDVEDVRALLQTEAPFEAEAVIDVLAQYDALLGTDRVTEFRQIAKANSVERTPSAQAPLRSNRRPKRRR